MPPSTTEHPPLDILITAAEAYPAFERLCLSATRRIDGGFRIFDLSTRLRSPEAREIGEDWFDLLLHLARRGVEIRFTLSDFDPVVGTELHGLTWRTLKQAVSLSELAGPEARVRFTPSLHPAEVGWLARMALWPRVDRMLREKAGRLMRLDRPRRSQFMQRHPHLSRLLLVDGSGAAPRLWPAPPLSPVTHHQKVAVIDDRAVYIGGLDLNERRWDDPAHEQPAEATWHDIQVISHDPAAARAARKHLEEFVDVIERQAEPSVLDGPILRTVSARSHGGAIRLSPKPILAEIFEATIEGIRAAERLIYIETQFFRDRRIAHELIRAARRKPDLTLILMLPARPEDVAFYKSRRSDARFGEFLQAYCVSGTRRAFRGRCFIGAPARPVTAQGAGLDTLHGAPIIYLHSKLVVFDDRRAIVSSANLNGRSMHWDTELGLAIDDPSDVVRLRHRAMAAMLATGDTPPEGFADPATAVGEWQRLAVSNARRRPEQREGFVLPYLTRPGRRFGRQLPAIPEEMV
ncbi:phospholipase D family protein [Jannaschia aquimarina]|uniref:Phospholipase D n=1 Tax=Jannaschia aquimarina TaxID=935700 RepID=A0A0D1ECG3_9RHOB|nr:phospholipase D family protein [Jannaschia aquimarina]KIT15414.1 Cardiolipin synthase [Jannaschia aquimarina]SNT22669.1 phospholipase D1/2 [Jannaschia aquimarina]